MLVPILIPSTLHELYHLLFRFWQVHGFVTLIAFGAGALLVFLLYSLFGVRRLRVVRRIISLVEDADIEELTYGSFSNRIRIRRSKQFARRHVQNVQAPAVRGTRTVSVDTLKSFGESSVYYFPENTQDVPEGLILPVHATWVFGDPPDVQLPLKVVPVLVDAAGSWYPAIVKSGTGLSHVRRPAKREFWKHGYRNLYIGDFVLAGDTLGTITVPGHLRRHVVLAPCDGFILQFGVQPYTLVVPGASVMLIGAPPEVAALTYTGNLAGYFTCKPDGTERFVGVTVEPETLLGNVSVLFGTFQEPVHAPARMRIVRQFVKNGDKVQYGQKLFDYIPLP